MTTSEQVAWAKAEAEKRWEGETIPQNAKPFVAADSAGFEQGILHVLSLLESETAVEAATGAAFEVRWPDGERMVKLRPDLMRRVSEASLAAAVAAITRGGSENG